MNYVQELFSIFNAPLFATFIIAMFWKRATWLGGALSMIAGSIAAEATHLLISNKTISISSKIAATWWEAIAAFVVDALVLIIVSLLTKPKPDEEIKGLVWALRNRDQAQDSVIGDDVWWRSPVVLAGIALVLLVILNIIFI